MQTLARPARQSTVRPAVALVAEPEATGLDVIPTGGCQLLFGGATGWVRLGGLRGVAFLGPDDPHPRPAVACFASHGIVVLAVADPEDEGQRELAEASGNEPGRPVRFLFDDAPLGGTPSERAFWAMVQVPRQPADDPCFRAKLRLTGEVLRVPAAFAGSSGSKNLLSFLRRSLP